ncbi:ankyrin repeat domain-containing protein [Shewanella nanhaiensis]|uniref:Ankyrin repeat domain-containing protein n=1 Tax=Shewanella nanhaiensis TaxID=2864872 RepID=A0ABS7E1D6_9GAMM|nr:ankyrin repeat domain-containing protein [Shewanella nanhaiensis]MBW8183453.1 ankyrin repeat domain-containing protein [Shewanella nanhaiensis]
MSSDKFTEFVESDDWDNALTLISEGFDVNEVDEYEELPIEVILENYYLGSETAPKVIEIILSLVESGAVFKTKSLIVKLFNACLPIKVMEKIFNKTKFKIPADILSYIVDYGADIEYCEYMIEIVKFLEKVDFSFTSKNLGLAITNSFCEYQTGTPLDELRQEKVSNILPVYDYLLSKGADINIKTKEGHTALMRASMNYCPELSEFFISKGAEINVQSDKGFTALMFASGEIYKMCVWSNTEAGLMTVKILLANNADPSLKNNNSRTAYSYAKSSKNTKVMSLLVDKGVGAN